MVVGDIVLAGGGGGGGVSLPLLPAGGGDWPVPGDQHVLRLKPPVALLHRPDWPKHKISIDWKCEQVLPEMMILPPTLRTLANSRSARTRRSVVAMWWITAIDTTASKQSSL